MAIILGTRGSQLALAQAELAKQAVERLLGRPEAIIRIIATTGDRRLDINLSQPGPKIDKGLFTKELEEALLSGENRCRGPFPEGSADRIAAGARPGRHLAAPRPPFCPTFPNPDFP